MSTVSPTPSPNSTGTDRTDRTDRTARAARARAVLDHAEQRTGAARWVRPVRPVPSTEQAAVVRSEPEPEPAAGARLLAVPEHLTPLLPSGGLDRGSTVVVAGSTSLVLALLSETSRAGGWVAIVGLPEVGVLAAHHLGLALERVVLVPSPGPDGPTVLAALLDGVDVVVVGPRVALSPSDRRRLSARARERGAVLMATTGWPGAHVVLTAEASRWEGLGRGDGRLRTRRLTVRRSGRGGAARSHHAQVDLPRAARSRVEAAVVGDGRPVTGLGEPAGGGSAGKGFGWVEEREAG